MSRILVLAIVFSSLFFGQCTKSEVGSIENITPKIKMPAIKEFVLGKTWENKLQRLGAMDWEKLLTKGKNGIPILRLTFQDNDKVTIENYQIAADGEQNLVTPEGNSVKATLISATEYQYRTQNENEIVVDNKQPHIVTKKNDETIIFHCVNNTDHPIPGCDLDFFEYRRLNQ